MADQDVTILNSVDSRLEDSDFVYTGNPTDEDIYVGSSATLLAFKEAGMLPDYFDIRDFQSYEEIDEFITTYVPGEEAQSNIRGYLYAEYAKRTEERPAVLVRGSEDKLQLDATGETPVESVVFTYDPLNYDVPSIRGRDMGLAVDDTTMDKAIPLDPPEGKEITQLSRTIRNKDIIPMFMDMVDTSLMRKAIYMGQDFVVTTLKLTPNPENLTINSSKKISRYTTMTRWVEEHWGDEIDNIAFNGTSFSFFGYKGRDALGNTGLTHAYRESTQAYKYMKELAKFFKTNGCIYQGASDYEEPGYLAVHDFLNGNSEFLDNHPRKGMIKERLYVRIVYDYLVLIGRFESFDMIEDSTSPYRFQYSLTFKAEKTIYRLDKVTDNGGIYPSNAVNPPAQSYDDISDISAMDGAFV